MKNLTILAFLLGFKFLFASSSYPTIFGGGRTEVKAPLEVKGSFIATDGVDFNANVDVSKNFGIPWQSSQSFMNTSQFSIGELTYVGSPFAVSGNTKLIAGKDIVLDGGINATGSFELSANENAFINSQVVSPSGLLKLHSKKDMRLSGDVSIHGILYQTIEGDFSQFGDLNIYGTYANYTTNNAWYDKEIAHSSGNASFYFNSSKGSVVYAGKISGHGSFYSAALSGYTYQFHPENFTGSWSMVGNILKTSPPFAGVPDISPSSSIGVWKSSQFYSQKLNVKHTELTALSLIHI